MTTTVTPDSINPTLSPTNEPNILPTPAPTNYTWNYQLTATPTNTPSDNTDKTLVDLTWYIVILTVGLVIIGIITIIIMIKHH
jgi:hypothetical protein